MERLFIPNGTCHAFNWAVYTNFDGSIVAAVYKNHLTENYRKILAMVQQPIRGYLIKIYNKNLEKELT